MEKPEQLKDGEINLTALKEICKNYVEFVDNDEKYHEDNDYDDYIFEAAMTAMYGEDIWDFINNRQE